MSNEQIFAMTVLSITCSLFGIWAALGIWKILPEFRKPNVLLINNCGEITLYRAKTLNCRRLVKRPGGEYLALLPDGTVQGNSYYKTWEEL